MANQLEALGSMAIHVALVTTTYQNWPKQNGSRLDPAVEVSVAGYENDLIKLSENLATYTQKTTGDVADYERTYQ
jgi:hypothetical protein